MIRGEEKYKTDKDEIGIGDFWDGDWWITRRWDSRGCDFRKTLRIVAGPFGSMDEAKCWHKTEHGVSYPDGDNEFFDETGKFGIMPSSTIWTEFKDQGGKSKNRWFIKRWTGRYDSVPQRAV